MYLLYDLMLLVAACVLAPYYVVRGIKYGKSRRGIRERLGFFAPGRLDALKGREVIWVHAVSVGETRAAIPLLKALRAAHPEHAILLTNMTETGHAIGNSIEYIDLCLFFPFDLSWVVRRVLTRVAPQLIVLVETEIWPNFVRQAFRKSIPVVLVNGRISDRSYPRYLRFRRWLTPLLGCIHIFAMQTELDAERIRKLGALRNRVRVTGNLKFDMAPPTRGEEGFADFRTMLGIAEDDILVVAGSTHPGEEEQLLESYRECRQLFPRLRLMLVPRHPERAQEVAELVTQHRFAPVLRSSCPVDVVVASGSDLVLVGDTLGEMLRFYAQADIVFVGGSLVPVGGHNILEASLLKKVVLFGPYMNNFKEISRLVLFAVGGRQVDDRMALTDALMELLKNPDQRERMGRAGHALLERHAGATERTLTCLDDYLGGEP